MGNPLRIAGRLPVLAVVALILAPGLALGYFGFRALAEREQSLRTNFTATTVLVRDRLATELTRLESALSPQSEHQGLTDLEAQTEWLQTPFILGADGSVVTTRLQSGMLPQPPDVFASLPALAVAVSDAEHQEFVRGDLDSALRLYERALRRVPPPAVVVRAFLLARIGRTLFKLQRFADGVAQYHIAVALAGDAVDRNGLPYAATAMLQIIDGCAALRLPEELATAEQRFADFVIGYPWDLDNGYGQHLARAVQYIRPGDIAARAEAAALSRQVTQVDWLRKQVYPQLLMGLRGDAQGTEELRHVVIPGDRPLLMGYRRIARGGASGPAVFGYQVRLNYLGGPLLAQVLKTVDLGDELHVTIREDAAADLSHATASNALAEAELLVSLPSWKVALFDNQGRSIFQLVARERWTYGALVAGMLTVMAVGLTLTFRASARATELARTRSDFVSNVSHELKTPLALIRMFGETLESGIVTDQGKRQEFYGIIRRESERLTHLIDNVLDLGRIDEGTKQYVIRPEDLVETVQAALDAYRPLFDRMGFTVETAFPRSPVTVSIDRDALIQSLVNLFQNVIKYSGTARFVSVSVQRGDGMASVSVADRGVGIPSDQIEKIFDRYYRMPQSVAAAPVGSGLGLAIVKHTIDAHGGRVNVKSTPGEGATFTLVLPTAVDDTAGLPFPASPGAVGV
jgi:signal transduction histidine kinase